ncbi:MAG TPA: hypothetical protein VFG87_05985 [Amycolatopsis sp.]|nr:hypothetical protein [Amycolatopsis sp.]
MPTSAANAPLPGPEVPGPAGGYRNAPVTAPGFDSPVPDIPGPPDLTGVLSVDTASLDKAVVVAGEAAGEAAGAAQRMESAMDSSPTPPWGDDPGLGQSFGSVFAEPRQALAQALKTVPEVLRELGEALQQTSRTFADTDDETFDLARSFTTAISRDAV